MALATLYSPRKDKKEERETGKATMTGISEGAIPFAAADSVHGITTIVSGNITGFIMNSINHASWASWIVLSVVEG